MTDTRELITVQPHAIMPVMDVRQAVARRNAIVQFVQQIMQANVHYGKVPGTDKNTLLKPGAELLTTFFGLSPHFLAEEKVQDWTGTGHDGEPFFYFQYRCQLCRGDLPIGEGIGSCNSWEKKYRYRKASLVCPSCGADAISRSRYPPRGAPQGTPNGWWCRECKTDYPHDDAQITGQGQGQVLNPNPADLVNTIDKMAQKRCLSGSTPIVIKTSRGLSRTRISCLARILDNDNETVHVPGIDGDWRRVVGYFKQIGVHTKRIDLRDGSYILATPEHQFPTPKGLRSVGELNAGDLLLRVQLPTSQRTETDIEIAWVAGLFLAEGNVSTNPNSIRFTLHENELEYRNRVTTLAERVGATWNIVQKAGKSISLNVHGQGFVGLMKDFVSGSTSTTKRFSKRAFNQGQCFLSTMLAGYLAGDGCWTDRPGRHPFWRVGFTGQNDELAKDLRTVCAMLDLRLSLKRSSSKIGDQEYPTYVGWIKQPIDSYNQCSLEEIVGIADEPQLCTVYDLEVDGDHLFLLSNGIQTHNSLVAATLIAVNASEFFTQDLEDIIDGDFEPIETGSATTSTTTSTGAASPSPKPQTKLESTPPKATNGNRPYSPEAIKAKLTPIVAAGSAAPATEKQRQLIAAKLNECFAEDPDADKKRYAVTHYLFGFESTKDPAMKQGHVDATLKWVLLNGKKDDTGDYPLHPKAPAEAAAIVREALIGEGQTEFDVATEELFDVMEGTDAL